VFKAETRAAGGTGDFLARIDVHQLDGILAVWAIQVDAHGAALAGKAGSCVEHGRCPKWSIDSANCDLRSRRMQGALGHSMSSRIGAIHNASVRSPLFKVGE